MYYKGEWLNHLHGNENDTNQNFAFEYYLKGHRDVSTPSNVDK
jgi:hypothetical protein